MNKTHRVTLVAPTCLLLACSAAVATRTDVNPSLANEMAGWRSYSWLHTPRSGDPRVYNDIVRARVQRAVDRALAARGFQIDSVSPDFQIGWHAGIESKLDVEEITDLYGYGWRVWYGPSYRTYVSEYQQGTLVLDFIDAGRNELAWRGIAEGRLNRTGPALPSSGEVDDAVGEIMEEFPLRSGLAQGGLQ